MAEWGSLRWIYEIAWKRGYRTREIRAIMKKQYGKRHLHQLTAEQLFNFEHLMGSLPEKEFDEQECT